MNPISCISGVCKLFLISIQVNEKYSHNQQNVLHIPMAQELSKCLRLFSVISPLINSFTKCLHSILQCKFQVNAFFIRYLHCNSEKFPDKPYVYVMKPMQPETNVWAPYFPGKRNVPSMILMVHFKAADLQNILKIISYKYFKIFFHIYVLQLLEIKNLHIFTFLL